MRWNREKSKAQAIFYWFATIVLILVIIGMLTDFISWKTAIGMIKKQMPTNGAYNELENYKFNWLWFTHPAQFHVYIASDENLNIKPYYDRDYGKTVQGRVDGVLPGVGGFNAPLINNHFETDVKSIKGVWHLKGQIYVLDKGEKIYKQVFAGYQAVDYPITRKIINTYKRAIDPDRDITEDTIKWLCSFTHDSLHKYIVSKFEMGKQAELFQKPGIYAYRLDGAISGKVKWKKVYKTVFTGERSALLGIMYTIDGVSHFVFIREAWRINCHGGGYIWSDLR